MNIGIYIYDQAEVLDFSGPFEVFTTASRICAEAKPFNCFLVAQSPKPVTARSGYTVIPTYCLQNHPKLDVLIVAGGVHTEEMHKPEVLSWVRAQSYKVTKMASVCTGAFILASAGLLKGLTVTTHWQDIDDLRTQFPQLDVVENIRWVDQGAVLTSAGISAGIDMCLHLVGELHSIELAEQTARLMDYDWAQG